MRQAVTHFGLGIPYSFFTMVDLNYGWMLQSFGLIRMNGVKEPVYLRPKFYAVQHVTSFFTPEMKATDKVSATLETSVVYNSIGSGDGGGEPAGCVLWLCGDRPTRSLERHLMDIRLEGITMKDPVYVDLLTGYVHDLRMAPRYHNREDGSTAFSDFPLWDSPVAIIERSKIKCIRK